MVRKTGAFVHLIFGWAAKGRTFLLNPLLLENDARGKEPGGLRHGNAVGRPGPAAGEIEAIDFLRNGEAIALLGGEVPTVGHSLMV